MTTSPARHTGYRTPAAFFGIALMSRLILMEPFLFNMDTGHFAFAVLNGYDMSLHQPHPPGYYLYVVAARALSAITGDPLTALTFISALSDALFVPLIYLIAERLFGRRAGLAAGVIALTSPLLWIHGIVGLSYSFEAMASAAVVYSALRAREGDTKSLYISAAILGLACGFRQTTLVFMYPVFLYCVYPLGYRRLLLAHLAIAASVAIWIIPMLSASGGLAGYLSAMSSQANRSVWSGVSAGLILHHAALQLYSASWALMAGIVPLAHVLYKRIRSGGPLVEYTSGLKLLLFWMLPALAFYIIVISRGNNPGYALVYSGALYIAAGAALDLDSRKLAGKSRTAGRGRNIFYAYIAIIGIINAAMFFGIEFNFSYRGMVENNNTSRAYIQEVRERFSQADTVVVGGESFFVSYRHACWYLPEYRTLYLFPLLSDEGNYHLSCSERTTGRVDGLDDLDGARYAVYFGDTGYIPKRELEGIPGAHLAKVPDGRDLLYFDLAETTDVNELPRIVMGLERYGR